jgi:hypothetical protein
VNEVEELKRYNVIRCVLQHENMRLFRGGGDSRKQASDAHSRKKNSWRVLKVSHTHKLFLWTCL